MTADYVLWQAIHAECDPDATCCTLVELEVPEEALIAAHVLGMPITAYLHMAVREGMRKELAR